MKQAVKISQKRALKTLCGEIDDFYLAGGTALSLYYFQHRDSQDLDFFTRTFSRARAEQVIALLEKVFKKKAALVGQESRKNRVKMAVYSLPIGKNESLKIDFIEDYLNFIKKPEFINGIRVLSIPDIYVRKIYAIVGMLETEDAVGRKAAVGGRQEAKDFFDLFCLSNTYMKLSSFVHKYCQQATREAIIRWFRTYDRFDIKTGLLELGLRKKIEYAQMESHFKKEINKMLEKEIEFI